MFKWLILVYCLSLIYLMIFTPDVPFFQICKHIMFQWLILVLSPFNLSLLIFFSDMLANNVIWSFTGDFSTWQATNNSIMGDTDVSLWSVSDEFSNRFAKWLSGMIGVMCFVSLLVNYCKNPSNVSTVV